MVIPGGIFGCAGGFRGFVSVGFSRELGECRNPPQHYICDVARFRYCGAACRDLYRYFCNGHWEVVLMNFLLVLSPQYGPAEFGDYTTVSVSGGVLTVEGRDYAFPGIEDGAELTMDDFADPYPVYQVRRRGETISVWIIYRYPADATHAARYPGIDPGRTPVMFNGVQVGLVKSIDMGKDYSSATADLAMDPRVEDMLLEGTEFWTVKPSISLAGITGLEALVKGNYIDVRFAKSGAPSREFTIRPKAPPLNTDAPGLHLVLTSDKLGSIDIGAPILYRQVRVGSVQSYQLSRDRQRVVVGVHIEPEYAHLVNTSTRFWNSSGITLTGNLSGVQVKSESLQTLITGGISFDTLDPKAPTVTKVRAFTPATPLANGTVINALAQDAAGNNSSPTSATVDSLAPAAPVIDPSNGSVIAGTAEAGATVILTDGNGNPIGQVTADGSGNWSFTPGTPLSNGTVVNAVAQDAAGNASGPASTTVDSVAPAAPVIDPSNGSVIAGTAEAGATVILTDGGGNPIGQATADGSGNWTFTPSTPLANGTVINAVAQDPAGNTSGPASVTVDAIAPPAPVINPSN